MITRKGQIKHHELCLTLSDTAGDTKIIMKFCDESDNQKWQQKDGGLIQHDKYNLCLDSRFVQDKGLTVEKCNSGLFTQRWRFMEKTKST